MAAGSGRAQGGGTPQRLKRVAGGRGALCQGSCIPSLGAAEMHMALEAVSLS